MGELRRKHIISAIQTWKEYGEGKYPYWEKSRYSKEYCQEQVAYFENLLKLEE